jgi:16S rRNA (uracil1498-N3)-methyltransferase
MTGTHAPVDASPADTDAAAHAFVDDLERPALSDEDRHHLERSLRLREDATISVADGAGRWRLCRLGSTRLTAESDILSTARATPALAIAFALVKGGKPELVVEKLTELGIDRVLLFAAERSVVRWDAAKRAKATVRLGAVARAAAMQSRRAWLPEVTVVGGFDDVARLSGATLAQRGGAPLTLEHPTVLIGPEGGWTPAELGTGLPRVDLSDAILRSETAAMTAAVGLASIRRDRQENSSVLVTQGD